MSRDVALSDKMEPHEVFKDICMHFTRKSCSFKNKPSYDLVLEDNHAFSDLQIHKCY